MAGATFTIELKEKVSGRAKRAAAGVEKLNRALSSTGRGGKRFTAAQTKWNRALVRNDRINQQRIRTQRKLNAEMFRITKAQTSASGGLGGGFLALTGANLLATAIGAASSAVKGLVVGFGEATIGGALFLESSRFAFKALLKDSKAGEQALTFVREAAVKYGLDVRETGASMKKLLAAQFKLGEAKNIIRLSADMKALGASGVEVQSIIRAITQIKGKGRLQMEELNQQLAETGLSSKLVFDNLSKALGKSVPEIQKMISAGKITADQGIAAIKAAIKQKLHIEKLGDAGEASGKTLSGMWDRFRAKGMDAILDLSESLLPRLQDVGGDAFDSFSRSLDSAKPKVIAFFNGLITGAKNATEQMGKLTGPIDDLTSMLTGEKIDTSAFEAIGIVIGSMVAPIQLGISAIKLFIAAFVTGPIDLFRSNIEAIGDAITSAGASISSAASGIGTGIIDGIVGGILGAPGAVAAALSSVVDGAISAAKAKLGIASPSKVFEEIGMWTGQGMAIGIESQTPTVSNAAAGLIRPNVASFAGAGGGTNVGGVTNTVNVTVPDAGSPEATAQAVAALLPSVLADTIENLNVQIGAA